MSQNSIPETARMVFKGKIFEVWQWEQQMFDGRMATFEKLKRPDTVQVLAAVGDKILVQEEEQPNSKRPFLTLPGGRRDEGEDPLEATKRELLEETGYVSDSWILWKKDSPVSKIEWTIYTYIAKDAKRMQEPELDGGEKITPRFVTLEELLLLSDDPAFSCPELISEFLRMRLSPDKKNEFQKLLFGK